MRKSTCRDRVRGVGATFGEESLDFGDEPENVRPSRTMREVLPPSRLCGSAALRRARSASLGGQPQRARR